MFARLKIHSGGSKRTCPQSGLTVKFCFPYVTDAQAVLFESISEQYDGETEKNNDWEKSKYKQNTRSNTFHLSLEKYDSESCFYILLK